MKKIKVLMIGSDNTVKGGITSVIVQLLKYDWSKKNIEMRFLPTYKSGNSIKKIMYFCKAYFKFLWLMVTYNPDLLHIHMSHNGSFYRKYIIHKTCKLFGKKDIIHLHGSEFKVFYDRGNESRKKRIRNLLKNCNAVFVLGEKWNENIKKIQPCTKTIVLYNAVALPDVLCNMESKKINILFLGVLVERKGVKDLLNAILQLKKIGILDNYNVKFKIGGTGPEEERLKNFVNENKLTEYVEFLGWVTGDSKIKLLQNSQIFVLPSYNEGLPIAILEAISYGLPVISTRVGSINEAVIENYNGHLIEAGDITNLVNCLSKIITNQEIRSTFGKNSRKLAEEKFDENDYYRLISKYYFDIYNV